MNLSPDDQGSATATGETILADLVAIWKITFPFDYLPGVTDVNTFGAIAFRDLNPSQDCAECLKKRLTFNVM